MGADYERSFRLDVIDHDKKLVFRGKLPGVEKNDIAATVMGDRLMIEADRKFEVAERHTIKVA
jgi:HSP20 family molecular chaperone IbpA